MKVAIVGAGISGLSAAYFLKEKDPTLEIEVFEKSKALGGRMATRRVINSLAVDTGCQFLSIDQDKVYQFFMSLAPDEAVKELPQSILCLPEGFIVESKHRYFLEGGMTQWAKTVAALLESRGQFKIHFDTAIGDTKELFDRGFDRVLVTAPGPQGEALGAKRAVEYHPCLCVIFMWHNAPREALSHYAYRDISSREGITWLGHEGLKRGQQGVWVAQLSPEASIRWNEGNHTPDELEDMIQTDIAAWIPLFGEGDKTYIDKKFWRFAFPIQFGFDDLEAKAFERIDVEPGKSQSKRLYFLGDGYKGVGRAENAIESAQAVCEDFFE